MGIQDRTTCFDLLFEPTDLSSLQINFISKFFSFLCDIWSRYHSDEVSDGNFYILTTHFCGSCKVISHLQNNCITILESGTALYTHILGWHYFKFSNVKIFAHKLSLLIFPFHASYIVFQYSFLSPLLTLSNVYISWHRMGLVLSVIQVTWSFITKQLCLL